MYTDEQILEAIPGTGGIKILIARKVGCSRETIRVRTKQSQLIAAAIESEKETTSDVAEGQLLAAIKQGKSWAVRYWLSTQAKNRGYTLRTELTGQLDTGGQVVVYLPANGREAPGTEIQELDTDR